MTSKWTLEEQKVHRGELTAALRSGDYKQCQGKLRRDRAGGSDLSFCCLGVGCDVSKQGDWDRGPSSVYRAGLDWSDTAMPWAVRDYFGFAHGSGCYEDNSLESLADDNDIKRKTFAEIADIIDAEPEGLVVRGPEAE